MPYTTVIVRKARTFVPREASAAAADLRAMASEGRELTTRLRAVSTQLASSWEGRSSVRFLDGFQGQPPAGDSSALWFDAQSHRVSSMTVTTWETVPETVWVPES